MRPAVSGDLLSSTYLETRGWAPGGTRHQDARWMRAVLQWQRRTAALLGPASAPRTLLDVGARPLLDLLGLRLAVVESHAWGHGGLLCHDARAVATLVCTEWGTTPAAGWRHALSASLAAHLPWALVFTGSTLAVFDATRPWARRCLAFDLSSLPHDPDALGVLHALVSGAALDNAAQGALARAVADSDARGVAVCAALGQGVLAALEGLVNDLGARTRGRASPPGLDHTVFDQSLTIVYRLLFLLFAEARQLVPVWHSVYREAYSLERLSDRLLTRGGTPGVWPTVQAMARLAHAGCTIEDLRVTAFNGRLFAPGRTPLAEHRQVRDEVAGAAVLALATAPSPSGRRRVAFHDLGVEQLGAVYERVLDYEAVRTGGRLTLRATSSERKTSGSFYTPRAMTDFVVRRTLSPLVAGRSADDILGLRILDPAMGSGAFLVAACRFLAERVEQARIAEGTLPDGDIGEVDRGHIVRSVAERCLYGLDRNPTAVQVARLSLWLTTMAPERPLTFLDHHLAAGNSLIGARLADLPHPPRCRDAPDEAEAHGLFDERARADWARTVVPERLRLLATSSDSADLVRDKEQRLQRLDATDGASRAWARAADLWCGLALLGTSVSPGLYADMQQHLLGGPTSLAARQLRPRVDAALEAARAHDAVHWELLFPEVFLDERGRPRDDAGFDAVLGNPPWEVMRADTGDATARAGARAATAAAMRFVRGSGHYPLRAAARRSGHVNQYQLFVERALAALRHEGRFGLILPAGLQYDVGSAGIRRALLDRCTVNTWIGFDNRLAIFPIHRGVRFLVVSGERRGRTETLPLLDAGSEPACLARLPDDARQSDGSVPLVRMSRDFLARWDPAQRTLPTLTTPLAMAVACRALAAPALSAREGWHITFGRDLNASDDRRHLVRGEGHARRTLPVVEGKHLRPFGVEVPASAPGLPVDRAERLLGRRWTHPRVCYRDVASATNRLTLLAALLPAGVVSTHTLFCAREPLEGDDAWCVMGLLNSLVANFLVRVQMTTHVTTTLMARLPVPRPARDAATYETLVTCARQLSQGRIESEPVAYARLNAAAARAYDLSVEEYGCVVSTFPLLPAALRTRCLEAWATCPTP